MDIKTLDATARASLCWRRLTTMKAQNITPPHLRCIPGSCPSVHRFDDGTLLIVGKLPSYEQMQSAPDAKPSADEFAITISEEYFMTANPGTGGSG